MEIINRLLFVCSGVGVFGAILLIAFFIRWVIIKNPNEESSQNSSFWEIFWSIEDDTQEKKIANHIVLGVGAIVFCWIVFGEGEWGFLIWFLFLIIGVL